MLNDFSNPQAILTAIDQNYFAFLDVVEAWPQVEICRGEDVTWVLTPDVPQMLFNTVYPRDLTSQTDAKVESLIERYRSRGLPVHWQLNPLTQPDDLGRYLQRHGLVKAGASPVMAVALDAVKRDDMPAGLRIERIADVESLRHYSAVFRTGFQMPDDLMHMIDICFAAQRLDPSANLQHYVGWLGAEPVATTSLMLAGGVAGIWCVTTIEQARGRGIASAMVYRALQDARVLGYRAGLLVSSAMGYSVYRRMGFAEYGRLQTYTQP